MDVKTLYALTKGVGWNELQHCGCGIEVVWLWNPEILFGTS